MMEIGKRQCPLGGKMGVGVHRKREKSTIGPFMGLFCLFLGVVCGCDEEVRIVQAVCGDGRIQGSEECDGSELGSKTCADFGFPEGELRCDAACRLDAAACRLPDPCADAGEPCPSPGAARCEQGRISFCETVGECRVWSAPESCPLGICADESSCVQEARGRPLWFVHVSDVHFGKYEVASNYSYFLENVVPVLRPDAVFVTGDVVDDGAEETFWQQYAAVWETRAFTPPRYLEIPGNHDVKGEGEDFWVQYTATGRWDPPLWGVSSISTDQGSVEVVRTNTSSGTVNVQNTNGYFSEAQASALLAIPPDPEAAFRVLLAHHPTVGLIPLAIGRDRMREVMAHFGSQIYLCGHLHSPNVVWDGSVLLVQAAEFGEDRTFMLVAWDEGALSVREMGLSGPWVQITSPADASLGGTNPLSVPFAPSSRLTVRAIGFSAAPGLNLQLRVQDGEFADMSQVLPNVWEGDIDLPAVSGLISLSVRAVSPDGSAQHDIAVLVQ